MKLSNSIKLSMANFSLFWKILIYKIVAVGLTVLMFLPVLSIFNSCLVSANFFEAFTNCLGSFQTVGGLTNNVFTCFEAFLVAVGFFAEATTIGFIYFLVLIFFIAPFFLKLSDIPASETTYSYMSSLNKNSFMVNFVDDFGKSVGYSCLKCLLEIPFLILIIAGVYGLLKMGTINFGLNVLAPLLLFVYVTFMISLKTTLLSGWVSSIVVFNVCAGKAFKKGLKAVFRRFWSTISSFAVVTIVMVAILYIFSLYSLIVIVPLWSLIITVFGQVLFFESQGMNYYVSPDRVITPRKLEQADSIKKVKDII